MFNVAIVGAGRLGSALAISLSRGGIDVVGPFGRSEPVRSADVTILAVPERAVTGVAQLLSSSTVVGHCSASLPLDALAPYERFNCHPLMTLNTAAVGVSANVFRGAACATDGNTQRARDIATTIASVLGMRPVHVPESKRTLYHAAASMASNYLVTLEAAAESLASHAGITRSDLAPLVRASLEAWIAGGFHQAISGPVSRGDDVVVANQRQAIATDSPELLPLFDVLTSQTRTHMTSH